VIGGLCFSNSNQRKNFHHGPLKAEENEQTATIVSMGELIMSAEYAFRRVTYKFLVLNWVSSVGIIPNPSAARVFHDAGSKESGCGSRMSPRPVVPVRHRLKTKCILARGDHCQRHRVTISARVHVFGFKPRT
jgi:hypothetical protein